MFKKILIANRGEIACRVMKTAREMGIATVAVYSDADRGALHVRRADEAVHIGGAASRDSYLKGDVIIAAAQQAGAEAIHPGYGFLSENEAFASACEKAGIVFIGPSAKAIEAMGLKDRAKDIMAKAGVPVVPGYQGKAQDEPTLKKEAEKIGWPVLIKAVAGGGGKGMRLVERAKDFAEALASCKREAAASFGNDHVLIEKYITRPRHVEVQVFGDTHGNGVYLFERDCSLQRRHQKVVEEAPAPGLSDAVRKKLGAAAVKAVKALKYANAGTIEFIMDSATQEFYFMEMNTRLQVEHPVTEAITGQDLVAWQIRVAAGEKLPLTQDELHINGHAFEVRLYAEDPSQGFLPQTGKITRFAVNRDAPGIRLDTGIAEGDEVSIHYDPMIAKLIVWGPDRETAAQRMRGALADTVLAGLTTNQEFLGQIFAHPAFLEADVDTGFIARHEAALLPENYGRPGREEIALAAAWAALGLDNTEQAADADPWDVRDNWRMNGVLTKSLRFVSRGETLSVTATCQGDALTVTYNGETFPVHYLGYEGGRMNLMLGAARIDAMLAVHGHDLTIFNKGRVVKLHQFVAGSGEEDEAGEGRVTAPMPGKIVNIMVRLGDAVSKDQPLLVMEAMKMEMTIRAGCDGVVDELPVAVNGQVRDGALLVSIKARDAA